MLKYFYDERNKDIYSAILRLDEMGIIPDTTTIFEEINNSGAFRKRGCLIIYSGLI